MAYRKAAGALGGALFSLLCSSGALAQVDATYRIVSHVDTAPVAVAPAGVASTPVDILKAYAASAALENGYISVKVLTDVGRSSRFEILETWSTKATYTAHKAAPSTATLTTAIAPWPVGPVEEIPHVHFK